MNNNQCQLPIAPTKEEVGAMIQKLRSAAGLTAADLGKKIGVSGSSVRCWEQGIYRMSNDNAAKIANVFNLTSEDAAKLQPAAIQIRPNPGQISQKIRRTRIDAKVSTHVLAERVGVRVKYIQGIENNTISPSVRIVKRIASALGCSVDDLVAPEIKPEPEIAPEPPKTTKPELDIVENLLRQCLVELRIIQISQQYGQQDAWGKILRLVAEEKSVGLASLLGYVSVLEVSPSRLRLGIEAGSYYTELIKREDSIRVLGDAAQEVLGKRPLVSFSSIENI